MILLSNIWQHITPQLTFDNTVLYSCLISETFLLLNKLDYLPRLKRSICPIIYSGNKMDSCLSKGYQHKKKHKQPHQGIVHGVFNKFPDVFVQAFKIVVDSWKFSMLLLYIVWDDWPIFMISASNEHLQQQLEYTLLKPDCHSWWISKMQFGHEEERYAIKFCFKHEKNAATETYGMLQTAFRPSCMNRASVFEWHKRFKEGRESVRDDERCGRSKQVNTPELIGQRVRVNMLRF